MSDDFDEEFYLTKYPDVANAIRGGIFQSGLEHYVKYGRGEGRQRSPAFDAGWYSSVYPLIRDEVSAELAKSSFDHYDKIGKFRGYLPNSKAFRPANGGAFRSEFGGLWTDVGNALDIVRGREELGMITPEQAEQLHHWITRGYIILKGGIDPEILDRGLAEIEAVYQGERPETKFLCEPLSKTMIHWTPELLGNPAKAVDAHWLSQAIRNLSFSKKIVDFLHLIFERRAMATQSLTFWLGSSQQVHQDGAYVTYSIPLQFAASWVALEDVTQDAGELFYYPGSHQFPDYKYAGAHKSLQEVRRSAPHYKGSHEGSDHVASLKSRAAALNIKPEKLLAKKGDVLIWHSDLAHGGSPISVRKTRKSIVTHYCPREIAPLYFERQKRDVMRNEDGSYYASQYYKDPSAG